MAEMRHSIEHLYALDVACGAGLEIEIGGKTWTFSPLTFGDMREVIVRARSEAMRAYNEATRGTGIGLQQRAMDVNTILFGTTPQQALTDPATQMYQVELSLRHKHTKETPQEIDKVVNTIFDDEDAAKQFVTAEIVDAVYTMTHGPFTQDDLTADKDGGENPTEPSTEAP